MKSQQFQEMEGEEVEAKDSLVSLSQHTNYLGNWSEQLQQHRSKIRKQVQEEVSRRQEGQRYDLRRWQSRRQSLYQLQYPIRDESPEGGKTIPKSTMSTPTKDIKVSLKNKNTFNRQINKIIQQGLIKLKLQHFRKNIQKLHQNIHQQEQPFKPAPLPRSFTIKKHHKAHLYESSRGKQQYDKSMHEYKNDFEQQRKKYSMPNLGKIYTHRYVEYGRT